MEYDGYFVFEATIIKYIISDGYNKECIDGKMCRGITFYLNNENIGYRAIYGTVEQMTNITSSDAKQWYIEMVNKDY